MPLRRRIFTAPSVPCDVSDAPAGSQHSRICTGTGNQFARYFSTMSMKSSRYSCCPRMPPEKPHLTEGRGLAEHDAGMMLTKVEGHLEREFWIVLGDRFVQLAHERPGIHRIARHVHPANALNQRPMLWVRRRIQPLERGNHAGVEIVRIVVDTQRDVISRCGSRFVGGNSCAIQCVSSIACGLIVIWCGKARRRQPARTLQIHVPREFFGLVYVDPREGEPTKLAVAERQVLRLQAAQIDALFVRPLEAAFFAVPRLRVASERTDFHPQWRNQAMHRFIGPTGQQDGKSPG